MAIEALVGDRTDIRDAPIEDALDLLQTAEANQAYHLPYGVELCVRSQTFLLRQDGGARHRQLRNTWEVDVPRV